MKNNRFAIILIVVSVVILASTGTSAVGVVGKSSLRGNGFSQDPVTIPGQAASKASTARAELGAAPVVTDHVTTGDDLTNRADCTRPTAKFAFSPTDRFVWQWFTASGITVGDMIRWEWIQPDRGIYVTSNPVRASFGGDGCFWSGIFISGQRAASLPGNWQVNVLYNDSRVVTDNFTIGGGTGGAGTFCGNIMAGGSPPGALQPFFNGVLNLGFILGGAGTCPPMVGLTRDRLFFARFGVEQVNSCLRFDISRFTSLDSRVPSLSGPQLEQEITRIITDLQLAVRQANLRCSNLSPTAAESLFTAMIRLGSAAGRTLCFNCMPPSAGALAANRNDLGIAQQNLQVYVTCLPGYDLGIFTRVDPGNIFDLIALYTATNFAICNSSCCCICSGG